MRRRDRLLAVMWLTSLAFLLFSVCPPAVSAALLAVPRPIGFAGGRVTQSTPTETKTFLGSVYEVATVLPQTVTTLEAESMPTKTAGSAITSGWNLSTNGYVEGPATFPSTVRPFEAHDSQTPEEPAPLAVAH